MTKQQRERGLNELYAEDPQAADLIVFGRRAHADRRGFLKGAGLAAMGSLIGATIPFHRSMPSGLIPAAFAQMDEGALVAEKDGLVILNDRPINMETPAHLLDDDITPASRHFVRNNGLLPEMALSGDASGWTLTVDGEVDTPLELTLEELQARFETVSLQLVVECAGNGRAYFNPGASGNQWTTGAVACSEWMGVRLKDVLEAAGVRPAAVYTGHYGMDTHLSGDPEKDPISRGVPIAKAMEPHNLIAFRMNNEPIPALHGFPCRLVVPGWPGSCSQKWLRRIQVRDVVHDGAKMTGDSYRVPAYPVAPGTEVPDTDMRIIESMPVKSLITAPETGAEVGVGAVEVRGHAWSGDTPVVAMEVSIDFGQTWTSADLAEEPNRYAWRRWTTTVNLLVGGYYEVWAKAIDENGIAQPPTTPGWNPKGYVNNMIHRIALFAT
ncbi:MAG: sulfite oxidase [Rhodospirillaceae bacterium]|nr:sulfite oxidase [Rhodospirillaceae bacterium]